MTDKKIIYYIRKVISDESNHYRYSPEHKGYVAPEPERTEEELNAIDDWANRNWYR